MKSGIASIAVMSELDNLTMWNEYQLKYNRLKQQIVELSTHCMSSTCLITLKLKYDSIINSKRESDNIKDVCGLLRVLEDRAVLDYNNIEPLKYIGLEFIQDQALNKMIHEYEMNMRTQRILPLFNVYQYRCLISMPKNSTTSKSAQIPRNGNRDTTIYTRIQSLPQAWSLHRNLPTSFNFEQQKIVFKQLSVDLDWYWRDLARFLNVAETEIYEIDCNKNFQLHEKALKALEIFGERSDPFTWQVELTQALKNVRRRDLIDMVNKILNINS